MKKIAWLFIFLGGLAWSQDIQSILERNPFDPNRGKQEEEQVEEEPEIEEIEVEELPILDGTMVLGSTRVAIFSFEQDGTKMSARVEMKHTTDYMLYLREDRPSAVPEAALPGRRPPRTRRLERVRDRRNRTGPAPNRANPDEDEEKTSRIREPIPNGRIAGYRVTSIAHDHVLLTGDGADIRLEMFREDTEKSRGGTKQAVSRPTAKPLPRPPRRPPNQQTAPQPRGEPKNRNNANRAAKKPEDPERKAKTEEIKKKF